MNNILYILYRNKYYIVRYHNNQFHYKYDKIPILLPCNTNTFRIHDHYKKCKWYNLTKNN